MHFLLLLSVNLPRKEGANYFMINYSSSAFSFSCQPSTSSSASTSDPFPHSDLVHSFYLFIFFCLISNSPLLDGGLFTSAKKKHVYLKHLGYSCMVDQCGSQLGITIFTVILKIHKTFITLQVPTRSYVCSWH